MDQKNLRRRITSRSGLDFSSNDYLGFADDVCIKVGMHNQLLDFPVGSSGSRLLRGNLPIHQQLETSLADFVGAEAAVLFPSGYQANVALLSCLLNPEDIVFSDQLNHASIIDGMRLSKAQRIIFKHNNLDDLEVLLKRHKSRQGLKFIVTESLFSMQGDLAPLAQLIDLASAFNAAVIVDESHATGLYAAGGRLHALGLQSQVLASVHTGGKALGIGGAWIAGSQQLKDYVHNFARGFIYSTAPMPAMAIALQLAMTRWLQVGRQRAKGVLLAANKLRDALKQSVPNLAVLGDNSPILGLVLADNEKALLAATMLQQAGFDIRAIREPTVPAGSARLRVTVVHANLSHIADLQAQLVRVIEPFL